jgi:pimeloyl-ACP methyl ester carboxylesterase
MAIYLHGLVREAEVVAFHYRGYRPSTGRPSAAALLEDAPLLYDCMIKPMLPAKVVVVGFSIGSGVAAHLARERSVDGVILVTPFDTFEQLARQHYGWLPIKLLLRHHMSPIEDLRADHTCRADRRRAGHHHLRAANSTPQESSPHFAQG